jgi:hypothetical protein
MEQTATTKSRPKVRRHKKGCCDELQCESGLRNNYYEGKRLTTDMFRVEQRYFVERRRLLNRALYGWGVVHGYGLVTGTPTDGADGRTTRRLRIRPGLAFDACGRELVQVGDVKLDLDDVTVIDKDGKRLDPDEAFTENGTVPAGYHAKPNEAPDVCWRLSVHYAEQRDGHVTVPDPCECDRHEWDRVCETVRYTLQRIDCDECCVDDDCGLDCGCGTGHCCDPKRTPRPVPPTPSRSGTPDQRKGATKAETAKPLEKLDPGAHKRTGDETEEDRDAEPGDGHARPRLPFRRGGCRCVCDHLSDLDVEAGCTTRLVEIEEACGRVYVDLKHGVPIACVGLVPDDCGGWTFGETVDACGPRRLIKRNDVLFDLIRGCDLTRLSAISWDTWHRKRDDEPIEFDAFSKAFGNPGTDPLEYETTFRVTFSRPVRKETVGPDCFAMTVVSFEQADRGWQTLRVPILRVITDDVPRKPGDPVDHVRSARLVVGTAWVEDGLKGWGGPFNGETWIEIEVRGDFILDCNGQPIDANAVGRLAAPSGNGTPGGTFLSTFRVKARPPQVRGRYSPSEGKGASS